MYLKEIEASGFKSFADKININLDSDITCVVGPNGSGKSNIVDAIRWVMGEQSVKSLRGENNMADVIFSGSKSRKPLNVASVSLTFDNTDHYLNIPYDNVSIKRRAYRTGENEYFLNGEKCRLKDITELFLDTGVGKSSFNIVSQGDISKILSSSPLERRNIIEEAAGIIKYKTRREEALRKLDRTLNNILRVNDIIDELSVRVEPLKKQSEEAKEYIEFKDKLKNIEVSLLVEEITSINNVYQESRRKIDNLNNELLKLNTNISDSKLEELKKQELELEKQIDILNSNLLTLTKEEEELNGKRLILKERSKYDANDTKVYENISILNERKISFNSEINIINNEINNLDGNILLMKNDINKKINEMEDFKVKKDNLNKEYNIKLREYQENSNRINIIKDNLDNNLLINNNVRRVLNNPRLSGILNAFGNILNTTDEYSKALEVCIMGSKNFIITSDENAAKDAINFLKDNHLGRCTFFPLNIIKPKGIDIETVELLKDNNDYLGILSDFINYDNKYRNIVLNQLGNILVTKNIDGGNRLSKLINNRYKIVTLDGEVIHVGGSITGGSINENVSMINLKNELMTLTNSNNILKNVLDDLNKNIDNINKSIINSEEMIYSIRSEYVSLTEKKNGYDKKYQEILNELKGIEEELNSLKALKDNKISLEEENITKEFYHKHEEKELLIKEINYKNKEYQKIKIDILNIEAEEKILNNDIKNKEKELKNLEIEISKMDAKLDNNLNILNTEYEMTYEKASNEYMLDMDINDARNLVSTYKNKLKNIGMVNIHAISEYEEVNSRYEFLTSQRDDLLNAKETLNSIIFEMDEIMQDEFAKAFKLLQTEFKKVFQMLFKGADATLKLTNPDNLLETGVDIIASPPGKSLKSISLLSGGEKTLTAISLLFAVLNIRQVPFCIFDEIEAALDENNVDIFGHYLDNYKNKTQFLLITHKKRTMEYAKTLYGITMQESGVSKLVSVKLEN